MTRESSSIRHVCTWSTCSTQNQNSETETWMLMTLWWEAPWDVRLIMASLSTRFSGPMIGFTCRTTPRGETRMDGDWLGC